MNFFKKPNNRYGDDVYVDAIDQTEETTVITEEDEDLATEAPKPASSGINFGGSSIEMKVVRPERFDSVSSIADHLLSGRTVVLNLEIATKETSRRLIDFLSGVAYSIDGQIKRIANNTYIITPNNVDVSDTAAPAAERADDSVETAE